jgi:hypothetical protein
MKTNQSLLLAIALFFGPGSVAWADRPIQLALWPPDLQLVHPRESIGGLRLQIYGRNADMTGLDIGLVNQTDGHFVGLGCGLANLVDGDLRGVQLGYWGYSRTRGDVEGWTSGIYSRVHGTTTGLQNGIVSMTDRDFTGWQMALAWSHTGGHLTGLQCGIVNQATSVSGLQLGLVNRAGRMEGLQLGLWNQIDSKTDLRVLPIVNWSF